MSVVPKPLPKKVKWERMIQGLGFGNAGPIVPLALRSLSGAERKRAAGALIEKLDRRDPRKRLDKERVQRLFEAAGEPPAGAGAS